MKTFFKEILPFLLFLIAVVLVTPWFLEIVKMDFNAAAKYFNDVHLFGCQ